MSFTHNIFSCDTFNDITDKVINFQAEKIEKFFHSHCSPVHLFKSDFQILAKMMGCFNKPERCHILFSEHHEGLELIFRALCWYIGKLSDKRIIVCSTLEHNKSSLYKFLCETDSNKNYAHQVISPIFKPLEFADDSIFIFEHIETAQIDTIKNWVNRALGSSETKVFVGIADEDYNIG